MQTAAAIDFEDTSTWPENFLTALQTSLPLILDYHREERRVDRLAREDLNVRFNRPHNPHAYDYRTLVTQLESMLEGCKVVLYHCTRLTSYEADAIKANGLHMLTPDLIQSRFAQAAENGLLTNIEQMHLQNSEYVQMKLYSNDWGKRTNLLYFCSAKSALKDEGGVGLLLGLWGGEATYRGHEEDPAISHKLKTIGKPCVVKCAVPFADMSIFANTLTECLISFFVSGQHSNPEPGWEFDVILKRNTTADEVIDIIDIDHPDFAVLTEHADWDESLQA